MESPEGEERAASLCLPSMGQGEKLAFDKRVSKVSKRRWREGKKKGVCGEGPIV